MALYYAEVLVWYVWRSVWKGSVLAAAWCLVFGVCYVFVYVHGRRVSLCVPWWI